LRAELLVPRPAGSFAGGVRPDLLERGFALVDTPGCVDESLFLQLTRKRTVLSSHCKRWWKFPQLARYGCWLEGLLAKALPEEALALEALEFRHEAAGSEDAEVDQLHADGSYLRSVYTLYGPTTIYRDGDAQRSVPDGQTLLLTALDRARVVGVPCTLHRRPGAGPERALIVCTFEPHPEQPRRPNIYRQVAQAPKR
jgi:hypothetical protein